MSEYYVTHSKYKVNHQWENCLTYTPDTTLKKSDHGTYTYYHCGVKIWSMEDTNELFNLFGDKEKFYDMDYMDYVKKYTVYRRYSDDCQEYSRKEYADLVKDFKLTLVEK